MRRAASRAALRWPLGQLWAPASPSIRHGSTAARAAGACALPTYPFERKRHWVDEPRRPPAPRRVARPLATASRPCRSDAATPPELSLPASPAHAATSVPIAAARASLVAAQRRSSRTSPASSWATPIAAAHFIELGLDSLTLTQVALQLSQGVRGQGDVPPADGDYSDARRAGRAARRAVAAGQRAPAPALPAAARRGCARRPRWRCPGALAMQPRAWRRRRLVQQVIAAADAVDAAAAGACWRPAPAAPAVAPAAAAPVAVPPHAATAVALAGAVRRRTLRSPSDEEAALAHTRYDVKKAFGAIARIHIDATELTARQQRAARRASSPLHRAHAQVEGVHRGASRRTWPIRAWSTASARCSRRSSTRS